MTAPRRLSRDDVITAAFGVLDDGGLDALTLRETARRLGVHLNSVSFQVGSKARLLELMADSLLGMLDLGALPTDPRSRVEHILRRYRRTLLSRRDGARLVAGTTVVERNTLRIGDAIVAGLLESGAESLPAVRAFWALHYFVIGLVLEEQSPSRQSDEHIRAAMAAGGFDALERVGSALVSEPFDARFEFGIAALLDSL